MNQDLQPATLAPRQTTARDFLVVLFRRKWIILGLFLVTSVTVGVLTLTTPTEYLSSGRVLIKRGEKESFLTTGRRIYSDWEEDMGTEVEVVRSAPVMERTRAMLRDEAGPGRPAVPFNPRNVDVEVYGRTNVLAIGYKDLDPQVAKQVCDALVRSYVEFRQHDFSMAFPTSFFEGELKRVQGELDHWTNRRRNFANSSEVVDLPDQTRSEIEKVSSLEKLRTNLEADLAEAEMTWRKVEELRTNDNIDLPTFSSAFSNENALIDLKGRIVGQEMRLAQLRETLRDDTPEVVAAAATLDTLKSMMRREVEGRIAMSKARVEIMRARLEILNRDYAVSQARLQTMPDKEMSLSEMDHRISVLKQRYTDLSRNSDQAQVIDKTTPSSNIVLLARAGNAAPSNARDYVRLALAPAFSIVVGIGIAFFLDGLDLTVRTAHHAEEAIELPVLATLVERRRRARGPRMAEAS